MLLHANLAAAAPIIPVFLTVIFCRVPYPRICAPSIRTSATVWKPAYEGAYGREIGVDGLISSKPHSARCTTLKRWFRIPCGSR